jgi:hypothetical protein
LLRESESVKWLYCLLHRSLGGKADSCYRQSTKTLNRMSIVKKCVTAHDGNAFLFCHSEYALDLTYGCCRELLSATPATLIAPAMALALLERKSGGRIPTDSAQFR